MAAALTIPQREARRGGRIIPPSDVIADFPFTQADNLQRLIDTIKKEAGVDPTFAWKAGDGNAPTVGPSLTLVGTPGSEDTPLRDPTGAQIPSETYDGSQQRYTTQDVDADDGEDIITIGLFRPDATIVNGKYVAATLSTTPPLYGWRWYWWGGYFFWSAYVNGVSGERALTLPGQNAWGFAVGVIDDSDESTGFRLWLNGLAASPVAVPAGKMGAGHGLSIGGVPSLGSAPRWMGGIAHFMYLRGAGFADPFLEKDGLLVQHLTNLATGIERKIGRPIPSFARASIATGYQPRPGNAINDGDMEAAGTGAYFVGNNALLTKETVDPISGTQHLRVTYNGTSSPFAGQTPPLQKGRTYHLTAKARSNGGFGPTVFCGPAIWTGVATADVIQEVDVVFTATTTTSIGFGSNATSASYVEFDDILVEECELDVYGAGMPRAGGDLGFTVERPSTNQVYTSVLFGGTSVTPWVADDASTPTAQDDSTQLALRGLQRIGPNVLQYANSSGADRVLFSGPASGTLTERALSVHARYLAGSGAEIGWWDTSALSFTSSGTVLDDYRRTEVVDDLPPTVTCVPALRVPNGCTLDWTAMQCEPMQYGNLAKPSSIIPNVATAAVAQRAADLLNTLITLNENQGELGADIRSLYPVSGQQENIFTGNRYLFGTASWQQYDGANTATVGARVRNRDTHVKARWGPRGMQNAQDGLQGVVSAYDGDHGSPGGEFTVGHDQLWGPTVQIRNLRLLRIARYGR